MGLRRRLIVLVLAPLLVVQIGTFWALEAVIRRVAEGLGAGYARQYALANRALLQEPLAREIALARQLADSPVIRAWVAAESDPRARAAAFTEMESYRARFIDKSWFYIIHSSLTYYYDDEPHTYGENRYAYRLETGNTRDEWYFATLSQVPEYALNVNYDQVLDVLKVWINVVIRGARGEPLGMTGTGIDISDFLHRFVDTPDPGSENIVLDRNLAIQAHRDRRLIDLQSLVKTDDQRSTIARLLDAPGDVETLAAALRPLLEGEPATDFRMSIAGRGRIVGATYLSDLGWYVLTLVDLDLLIGRRVLIPVALLGVGSLTLLALAVALLVNRSVLAPIVAMTNAARSLASGVLETPELETRHDEVGALAKVFTHMADRIRVNTETLEARVSERTAALDLAYQRLAEANQALEKAATTDLTTGLLNRRGIQSRLEEETARATRGVSTLCLMVIDLDHFKDVNDRYGHESGDRMLAAAAGALKTSLRSYDLCARWGGEEFLVVSPGLDREGALALADKLREVIARAAVPVDGDVISVTASIGLCRVEPGESPDRAISRADRALYLAKKSGRNRVVMADPPA